MNYKVSDIEIIDKGDNRLVLIESMLETIDESFTLIKLWLMLMPIELVLIDEVLTLIKLLFVLMFR